MLKRQEQKKDVNLITIYRSRPEFDIVSIVYNIIFKEDLEETKIILRKAMVFYDMIDDLNSFIEFYLTNISLMFNIPIEKLININSKEKIKYKNVAEYINCENIKNNLLLFYREKKKKEILTTVNKKSFLILKNRKEYKEC